MNQLKTTARVLALASTLLLSLCHQSPALAKSNKHKHSNMSAITCMANNIYHEAGNQGIEGMQAVASVTMNRVLSGRYPSSVCGVVYQHRQFSWVGKKRGGASNTARAIAAKYVNEYNRSMDVTGNALFFHANYVKPKWKGVRRTKQIGRHIFYR